MEGEVAKFGKLDSVRVGGTALFYSAQRGPEESGGLQDSNFRFFKKTSRLQGF